MYTVSLTSPIPPAGASTLTWAVTGTAPDPRREITGVELAGCWTAAQVASAEARDAANASLRVRVHGSGRTAGHIEVAGLSDHRLPATISVTFRSAFGSVRTGTTATVQSGKGAQAGSSTTDVAGPTCQPAYRLALSAGTGGHATVSPLAASYAAGTAVTISAPADAGYEFSGWTVDGKYAGLAIPLRLTMNADHTVVATFASIGPPPDLVAPPLDPSAPSSVFDATSFLYSGPGAVQVGVPPDTIQADRVAVLRGKVLTPDGEPLPGARITVLDHPEFGRTQSRADGMFDLAVNGGGPLTIQYAKTGLIPVQRQVATPWEDFAWLPDVVLAPYDTQVTTVDLASSQPTQVARGTAVSDASGTRQATLLFSQGTTATMTMPDGSTQPLSSLDVRATELTVGDEGPASMPAELPPTSGYTYAVELSVDTAVAAGATEIRFDTPVAFYVENFLGFPVGTDVPVGYYDRATAAWLPSDDGRVIAIVGQTGGKADLDVSGDGAPDDAATLGLLGIDDPERERLAILYEPGQSLWRTPVGNFSPWDCNWPYVPPPGATGPRCGPPRPGDGPPKDCKSGGSVISCLGQDLGESIDIAGTPFSLNYQSSRAPGRKPALVVPLSADTIPSSLKRMDVKVEVAGTSFTQSHPPSANTAIDFAWDGKDAYGRTAHGAQLVSVQLEYAYDAVYATPAEFERSFGQYGTAVTAVQARGEVTIGDRWSVPVGSLDGRASGLGGWTLNVQQAYDPVSGTLHDGGGDKTSVAGAARVIDTFAGNGQFAFGGDGGPATQAMLAGPSGVAIAPDGCVYVADEENNRVRRIDPDGIITTVAGTGSKGFSGDGGPATQAALNDPSSVALGLDGSLYVGDALNFRVRRITPGGTITTFAGGGSLSSGEAVPATDVSLGSVSAVAVGPDGSLYLSETVGDFSGLFGGKVRRVSADGLITTVAGVPPSQDAGDGGPARRAYVAEPRALAVAPDGTLYIGDNGRAFQTRPRVRRVGTDGIITTYAGGGAGTADGGRATDAAILPQGLAISSDGLYISSTSGQRVLLVSNDGLITTVAGTGHGGFAGDGGPAAVAMIGSPFGIAVAPNGDVLFCEFANSRVRRVRRALPALGAGGRLIASSDGQQLFHFDDDGRHVRTLHALTGAVLYQFFYDEAGRLTRVTDVDGNVTSIERAPDGNPSAIVAPGGQRTVLEVNGDGYLVRVVNPANEAVAMTYESGGLLSSLTEPGGGVHRYTYDALGRLASDKDPAGATKTLTRTELADGHRVVLRTALGLQTTFESHQTWYGTEHVTTDTAGGRTVNRNYTSSGREEIVYPDGREVEILRGPDPRFGMQAPRTTSLSVRTPGGLVQTFAATRSVSLSNPEDPLSLQTLTDTATINGRTSTQIYDAATRTLTARTPAGRESSITFDARAHVTARRPAQGVDPVMFAYGPTGLLTRVDMGIQRWTYGYDTRRRPISRTDAKGRITTYTYDDADRVLSTTAPNGAVYSVRYDLNGNPIALTMPKGAVHRITYNPVNLLSGYRAPSSAVESWDHDLDRRLRGHTRALGGSELRSFDPGGRLDAISTPEASVAMAYSDATDRPSSITRTPAGPGLGGGQEVAFSYDGTLTTAIDFRGPASAGRHTYTYDDNLFLTQAQLESGGQSFTFDVGRDVDGLITALGPFAWTRSGPGGAISQIGDGTLLLSQGYDSLAALAGRRIEVADTELYRSHTTFDSLGLVAQRVETIGGTTHTFDYVYDANQQLVEVKRDDATVERYGYDPNANRTSRQLGSDAEEVAVYDAQDRLMSRGSVEYQVDDDGFLVARGSDTFTYGTQGELLTAHVGDQTITYSYDALGRRVAKELSPLGGQSRVEYLYGDPGDVLRVTAVRSGSELTVLFYDEAGSLYAFERAGSRYYVASDHLGSPCLVATVSDQVVKAIEYDAFGAIRSDSDPGFFLPIGFAGGLADPKTGLVRFGYRDYEPAAGRWTARDPVLFGGGQANLYAYVGNSPVTLRDPSGLWCFGGSVYDGVGAGAKVCHDEAGFTLCAEAGIGLGTSVDLALEGRGGDKLALVGEAGLECGPVAGAVGFEYDFYDRCGNPMELTGKCQFLLTDTCGTMLSKPPLGDTEKCSGQAKLTLEACFRPSGPLY